LVDPRFIKVGIVAQRTTARTCAIDMAFVTKFKGETVDERSAADAARPPKHGTDGAADTANLKMI